MSPIPARLPAPSAVSRTGRSAREGPSRLFGFLLTSVWLVVAGYLLFWGLEYYLLPLQERPYSDLHHRFKPTGTVGNRLGIAGTFLIAFGVASYMLRKRWGRLQGLGRLRDWLTFHIWCCTLGPFLVLLHTSFRVGGLVAIAFWSMVLVVASGIVGRYVYVRLPRTLQGRSRSMAEIQERQHAALDRLLSVAAVAPAEADRLASLLAPSPPNSLLGALAFAVRADFSGPRLSREIRSVLGDDATSAELLEAAHRYRRSAQQNALLVPFERLFRYWHTFHLPLAIVMLLIVLLHIGVAFAFGYAWTPV